MSSISFRSTECYVTSDDSVEWSVETYITDTDYKPEISKLKYEIADLKSHLNMKRISTSQAAQELIDHMNENSNSDALLSGFIRKSENPFHSKICEIL